MEFTKAKLEELMGAANAEVKLAIDAGNSPFGALLIDSNGSIVERAYNTVKETNDPSAHAEINLLRKAAKKLNTMHFSGYAVVVNAEPCSMCSSAIIRAQIRDIFYGASHEAHFDPELTVDEVASHAKNPIHVQGKILESECLELLHKGREVLIK